MRSRVAVHILIFFVFTFYGLALLQHKSYWPFIAYDMYCEHNPKKIDYVVLSGKTQDGAIQVLDLMSVFNTKNRDYIRDSFLILYNENKTLLDENLKKIMASYNEGHEQKITNLKLTHEFANVIDEKNRVYEVYKTETLAGVE